MALINNHDIMTLELTNDIARRHAACEKALQLDEVAVHVTPIDDEDQLPVARRILPYLKTVHNLVDVLGCDEPVPLTDATCTGDTVRFLLYVLTGGVSHEELWRTTDDTELAVLCDYYFSGKSNQQLLQLIAACEYLEVPLLQRVVGFHVMRRIVTNMSKHAGKQAISAFGVFEHSPYVWRHVFQHCDESVYVSGCLGYVKEWDVCIVEQIKAHNLNPGNFPKLKPDIWSFHRLVRLHGHPFDLSISLKPDTLYLDNTELALLPFARSVRVYYRFFVLGPFGVHEQAVRVKAPHCHSYNSLVLHAVKARGELLKDVPDDQKTYEVCLAAVKQNEAALQYVPLRLLSAIKEKLTSVVA